MWSVSLLLMVVYATVRGQKEINAFGRSLSVVLVRTAICIVVVNVTLLLAGTLLLGMIPTGQVKAAQESTATIEKLDGITVDYSDYVDSSVMYQLPQNIRDDEEISVIITLDQINLMDAYDGTDKTMSFAEFAESSTDAAQVKADIALQQAQILQQLDGQEISYTTGKQYDTLLSGFELVIRASDYEAVCKSVGSAGKVIVGEVYRVSETQLVENTVNVYDTGIFKSGESGYDGILSVPA